MTSCSHCDDYKKSHNFCRMFGDDLRKGSVKRPHNPAIIA
jgi:hypothetical protein